MLIRQTRLGKVSLSLSAGSGGTDKRKRAGTFIWQMGLLMPWVWRTELTHCQVIFGLEWPELQWFRCLPVEVRLFFDWWELGGFEVPVVMAGFCCFLLGRC